MADVWWKAQLQKELRVFLFLILFFLALKKNIFSLGKIVCVLFF